MWRDSGCFFHPRNEKKVISTRWNGNKARSKEMEYKKILTDRLKRGGDKNLKQKDLCVCVCLPCRGLKDMESDISSIEKRFAYGFLQKLLKWMDIAQEFIAHLGMTINMNTQFYSLFRNLILRQIQCEKCAKTKIWISCLFLFLLLLLCHYVQRLRHYTPVVFQLLSKRVQ